MRQAKSRPEPRDPVDVDLAILEESSVVATLMVGADGRIQGANAGMRRFLGLVEGRSPRPLADYLVDPADAAVWSDPRDGARPVRFALRAQTGTVRTFRGEIKAVGDGSARRAVGIFTVDDNDGMRAAAQHSARMEALGSLTAGVAHDFNNLLTVLVGNLYLMGEELREQPKLFAKLKAARDAGKRGTELIKQLLAFARREELAVGNVAPGRVIDELLPLLRRALGARITLETLVQPDVGSIRANTAQLESVLVNLAVNARDAIEGRGKIVIDVRREHVAPLEAGRYRLAHGGAYVAISVTDTGSGIPPEIIDRVFEPFFSTKGERGGTGLGLSMVRWFAEQAGGSAEIRSTVGGGTVVTLRLPQQAEAAADAGDKTMPLSTLPSGTERVVVLASDEALRATIHQTLEVLGYEVTVAAGIDDLLARIVTERAQLAVVDGLGGADMEAVARARTAHPGLKIVVTIDSARTGERPDGIGALPKPFTLADLAGTVRRTLDER